MELNSHIRCKIPTRGILPYSEYFLVVSIEDVRRKRPMGTKPLSAHGFRDAAVVLSHIPNVVAMRIQDYVFVGLFKAEEDVHHFDLPLYHNA